MEQKIIAAAVQSREAYETVLRCGPELSEQGRLVLEELGQFYRSDPACSSADVEILRRRLLRRYPRHKTVFLAFLEDVESGGVSVANVEQEVRDHTAQAIREQLAAALLSPRDQAKVHELWQSLSDITEGRVDATEEAAGVYNEDNFWDLLFGDESARERIPIGPTGLARVLGGGLRRHHHLVLFGRPDAGKTLFAILAALGAAKAGYRVLYFTNEGAPRDIGMRMCSSVSGLTTDEVEVADQDPQFREMCRTDGGLDRITIVDKEDGSLDLLNEWCTKYEPDLLVVDQLKNLQTGHRVEAKVLSLEAAAQGVRKLGKRHNCATVSTTQAGDSGDNKANLRMGDVDWSNTGIPGACEVMCGIGVTDELAAQQMRVLSFPKNKLGDKESIRVRVDEKRNRVL